MYEDLIGRMRNWAASFCGCCRKSNKTQKVCDDCNAVYGDLWRAADAIEELQQPRWIPVTEEPPLKVGDDGYNGYLVYAKGYYEVADYATDKYDNVPYFHVDGEYELDVTYFMPLPEPPKEET